MKAATYRGDELKKMKSKILMMCYIDMKSEKGDSIRAREMIREMSKKYEIEFIGLNAGDIATSVRTYSVPLVRKCMPVVWNAASLLYGLYSWFRFRPEAIYADTPVGSISPALLSMLTRTTLFLEVHGPVGARDIALYRAKSKLRTGVARWMERTMFRRARLVFAAQGWAKLVKDVHKIRDERIAIVPLAVNHELFRPLDLIEHRRRLDLPLNALVAVFVGNVGPWQGLETLIQAAGWVLPEHPRMLFLIVGDGAARDDLISKAQALKVGHAFRFIGTVPYERVPDYIAAANVGLALFPGNRGERGGVSSLKTLNYLACGRPIIISEMDELAADVERCGAGKAIPPDDPKSLAQALSWVSSHPDGGGSLQRRAGELGATIPSWAHSVSKTWMHVHAVLNEDKARAYAECVEAHAGEE